MTRLTILEYPDPRLRTVAKPVTVVDDALRRLIDDMLETMYAGHGVGLAATQVNVHRRLLVADVSEEKNEPLVFINPRDHRTRRGRCQPGGLPVGAGHLRRCRVAPAGRACGRSIVTASPSSGTSTACSPFACSTRWITWRASCSSTICLISSAPGSARVSRRNGARRARERGDRARPRDLSLPSAAVRIVYAGTPDFAVPALRRASRPRRTRSSPSTRSPTGRGPREGAAREPVKAARARARSAGRCSRRRSNPQRPRRRSGLCTRRHGRRGLRPAAAAGRCSRCRGYGCINIHASLLPRWRGAAPIQRAIEAGDAETGISIMQMEQGLDTGPVYASCPSMVPPVDTAGSLAVSARRAGRAAPA